MKKSIGLIIVITTCSNLSYAMRAVPPAEQEVRMYGRMITIKNHSDYPITASVNNEDREGSATRAVIDAHSQEKILVKTGKTVTLTTDVNGKTIKHNFRRKENTENIWEVDVKEGRFLSHIEIVQRASEVQVGFY